MTTFIIVGVSEPLYEAEFKSSSATAATGGGQVGEDASHLSQFILHSSLDLVERCQWTSSNPFLRVVDRFNDQLVSAYLCPSGVKLLLLHDGRSDDSVGTFFREVHELYVKHMINPFYAFDTAIVGPAFDQRVRALAKKHL